MHNLSGLFGDADLDFRNLYPVSKCSVIYMTKVRGAGCSKLL